MIRLLKNSLNYYPLTAILSMLLFFSCSKDGGDSYNSEYFSMDGKLTGMEVVDQELGLKFFPPKNWELQQTSISKKIETRDSANPNDNFVYSPTYIFFDDSTGGLLSVGKVVTADTTFTKSARLNFYKGLIGTKHKNDKLVSSNYIHSKIYFSQFKIEKFNIVAFKLFFLNQKGDIIEFDYTVPASLLERIHPAVKSSIGSIRLQ